MWKGKKKTYKQRIRGKGLHMLINFKKYPLNTCPVKYLAESFLDTYSICEEGEN